MHRLCTVLLIVLTTIFGESNSVLAEQPGILRVYFGTYTGDKSRGIYVSTLDLTTGTLSPAELAGEAKSPSFVAVHPNQRFLYAVSEIWDLDGKPTGGVIAFSIDAATGKLTQLNQQSSQGPAPCHLVVDAAGKNVLVANYGGGSVAVLPIGDDGRLAPASAAIQHHGHSVNPQRQEAPHAHSVILDSSNRLAFVADLGLDKVLIYKFDGGKGTLTPNDPAEGVVSPGSGPRHFAFHPSGKFAFVNNELTSTVTAFQFDAAKGSLSEIQTLSTLPQPTAGNSTAEIFVHASGKFLYVSNRGHDSLAIFQCDPAIGRLTATGHHPTGGKTPRNFNIDPTGQYILAANQDSHSVVVLKIDQATGQLTTTGQSIEVGRPVCVCFVTMDK